MNGATFLLLHICTLMSQATCYVSIFLCFTAEALLGADTYVAVQTRNN